MPATLGQLIHVLEDVFSRIKHGSDIPGAPQHTERRGEQHLAMTLQEPSAGTELTEMSVRCLLNAWVTEQFLQIITSSHTAWMSVQNEGQVRQKILLWAIQPPFPSPTTLCLISQSLTSRCTDHCYFWSQSRIFHPHLENALGGCKNLQTKQEGYITPY